MQVSLGLCVCNTAAVLDCIWTASADPVPEGVDHPLVFPLLLHTTWQ